MNNEDKIEVCGSYFTQEEYNKLADGRTELEIEQLQSNWNSLREWLEVNDRYSQGYFKQVVEYMSELESGDNN